MTNFRRMDPRIKLMWTRALTSAEYKQITGYLRVTYPNGARSYCCLGVLCELHAREIGGPGFLISKEKDVGDTYLGEVSILPDKVIKWAGLTNSLGYIIGTGKEGEITLTYLDNKGINFQTLAIWIEKYL